MTEAPANTCIGIVDDDESLCRSVSRLLRIVGYQPVTFPSAEALLADPSHPQFGCLLVDVQLGGMSGLELQRQLHAQGNRTPLIFITAHDDPAARDEAFADGCAGFFRKTDSGALILEAMQAVLAEPSSSIDKSSATA